MDWFFFALLSVFAMAGSEITQKIALTRKINISAITNNAYIWLLQGLAGITLALLFGQFTILHGFDNWLKLCVLAVVYFIGGTAYYTSYKSNSPSISIVLGSVSVVVSSTLGILLFSESNKPISFLGIGFILISILILNLDRNAIKVDKYNALALLGGVCFGLAYTIDKSFILEMHPFAYLGFMSISVALASFVIKPKHILNETKKLSPIDFLPMVIIALFGVLCNLFTFFAYSKGGNVGVVDAINNTMVFLVILAEIVFLHDKTNLLKKLSTAFLAILGVLLLSI